MAVRIRMKKLGRRHRPFFRICATDARRPRDGRVLEELGTYDPLVPDVDARTVLDAERIDYWISVGAQPSDKVGVLIKKYGNGGTHLEAAKAARERLAQSRQAPALAVPQPVASPPPVEEAAAADEQSTPEPPESSESSE